MKKKLPLLACLLAMTAHFPAPAHANEPVTIRGIEHVAVTVPNLKEATDFFVNTFGCKAFYKVGPYPAVGGFGEKLGVSPDTELVGFELIRCGNGSNIELFEYKVDGAKKAPPLNSDVGGHHIAFYVDDIDKEIAKLKKMGIKTLGDEANINSGGPNGGSSWIYAQTPWGMTFELVSYPNGMEYEKSTPDRLWDPRNPEK